MSHLLSRIDALLNKIDHCLISQSAPNSKPLEKKGLYYYDADSAPYRFDSFNENARQYFKNNGYVAITNTLTNDEINHFKSLLWEYLEKHTKMRKNDINTWDDNYFKDICTMIDSGITGDLGIGQSEFQWYIRTHPKLLDIFVKLWNVSTYKDLLCSMDGICIFRPFIYNTKWKTKKCQSWFHVDQNPILKPNFTCVQGYITMYDQNENTGGTTIIPKSHLKFSNIPKYMTDEMKDTPILNDYVQIDKKCKYIMDDKKMLVCLKKGDLFIWDSRLVHCSSRALSIDDIDIDDIDDSSDSDDDRDDGKDEYKSEFKEESVIMANDSNGDGCDINGNKKVFDFLRLVSFVTYSPKSLVQESIKRFYKNRVDAFIDQMTLTHWPHEFHIAEEPIWEWRHILRKNNPQILGQKKHEIKASLIGYNEHVAFVQSESNNT